tara:strand:- start:723 stop:1496 length:774 start_codon:yes stop_codon:yes gene_type:complete
VKAVILAGGFGTRLSEETNLRPKPMVEVGGKPLLWHIMKSYSYYGVNEFIICLGYMGYAIKEYFLNYYVHNADVTVDLASDVRTIHQSTAEPWNVHLIETGLNTMTGGRVKRIQRYVGDETFCLTYGDGLADLDIASLIAFHKAHGRAATVTSVQPPGRFGVLELGNKDQVVAFKEKPSDEIGWINGGFFVLEPTIFDYIRDDQETWEGRPLQGLAEDGELYAYKHSGFWRPCDTLRDKRELEGLWDSGKAPWRRWA